MQIGYSIRHRNVIFLIVWLMLFLIQLYKNMNWYILKKEGVINLLNRLQHHIY